MAAAVLHPVCSVLFLLLSCRFSGGLLDFGDTSRRKLSMELNPGLNTSVSPPPPGINLLHIRALGNNDTLHVLLCSQGAPTLLLVHTNSTSSSVQVDWPVFLTGNTSDSLQVVPKRSILYSSALVFFRLWEYNDINNTADPERLPASSFLSPYQLQDFTWGPLDTTLDAQSQTAKLCGGDGSPGFTNGSLCLQLSAFGEGGRGHSWPSYLHNANSSQIRVWLDGVLPRANDSRFMLEMQAVGRPHGMDRVEVLRSIDDEFTPSIFTVSQWIATSTNTSQVLGFVQWKPVAYRQPNPIFEDATPCHHTALVPLSSGPSLSGLVQAFYGAQVEATGLNISFGLAGEPFYNITNYLSWTVLVGIGYPPMDTFSPLVLSIMAVGLGTPLLLLLLGGVFVCSRNRNLSRQPLSQQPAYQPIN